MNVAAIDVVLLVAAMAVLGLLFGRFYFALLNRTVLVLLTGRRGLAACVLTAGRIGAVVMVFGMGARLGAASLSGTLAGFLLARASALHAHRDTD